MLCLNIRGQTSIHYTLSESQLDCSKKCPLSDLIGFNAFEDPMCNYILYSVLPGNVLLYSRKGQNLS